MLYTYLTQNFLDWAELFLRSYALIHDNAELIHLETRNLSEEEQDTLRNLYPNLVIRNKPLTIERMSKQYRIPVEQLVKWRRDITIGRVIPGKSVIWKNMIADGDRIKSFVEIIKANPDEEYYIFLDIDIIFRRNIGRLKQLGRTRDISIKFRPSKGRESSKVMIGNIVFRNSAVGVQFAKRWWQLTNGKKMLDRPRAWGQIAFWRVWKEMGDNCSFFNLPIRFVCGNYNKGAIIWSGHKGGKRPKYEQAAAQVERLESEIL